MAFLSHLPVILGDVEQLTLLCLPELPGSANPQDAPWQLDEHTRAVGRQGVSLARQALLRRDKQAA